MDLLARLACLVVPPACASCGRPVDSLERLCAGCRRRLPWLGEPCARCGLPGHGARCPRPLVGLERAWAPLAYEGPARDLVLALKYRGALPLAAVLAAQIAANLPAALRAGGPSLVRVPPQPGRRRSRGFDPVQGIWSGLAARTGMEAADCLRRIDRAPRQVGSSRSRRRRAGRLGLAVRGPVADRVLLVDDVITTGATLEACAATLRAHGASWVAAVAYARAL